MKTYIVQTKADDYGACITEVVETTKKNAKEYYHHEEVKKEDVPILIKYISFVCLEEEVERTDDRRFYGCE